MRTRRKELKLTHVEIAKATSVTESAVSQWESGYTAPANEQLPKLADVLETSVGYILTGVNDLRQSSDRPAPDVSAVRDAPRDVPVFGTVPGGPEGYFIMNSDEITEFLPRPAGIASLKEVYGLYIVGDSMRGYGSSEGDLIYVSPTRPPVAGGLVVVQLHDTDTGETTSAMVKQYVSRTPTTLRLAQFNPAKEITVPMNRVKSVHRVLTLRELMGA
jgi:SOS-response transcriptional repressor LexA